MIDNVHTRNTESYVSANKSRKSPLQFGGSELQSYYIRSHHGYTDRLWESTYIYT